MWLELGLGLDLAGFAGVVAYRKIRSISNVRLDLRDWLANLVVEALVI